MPKAIARNFPDTVYFDVLMNDNQILLKPVQFSPASSTLEKTRLKMKKLGITERDVEEAITWARKGAK